MVSGNKQAKALNWVTFTGHAIRLAFDESLVARGLLIDGTLYALGLKVIWIDDDSVILRCAGHISEQEVPAQDIVVSLVPGQNIQLDLHTSSHQYIRPSLYLFWEPSVQVSPGEIAVLVIAQCNDEGGDSDTMPSNHATLA